jgi:hypothetical protein
MRKLVLAALTCGSFVACVAFARPGARYYLTKPAYTFSDSTADSAVVFVDDKVQMWLNGILLLGRKEQLEQAACLRIAKRDGNHFWVDSVLKAYVEPGMTTTWQIYYECGRDHIAWHAHVIHNEYQCTPSSYDTAPAWSRQPALMLSCGIGIDSVVAWRARKR